MPVPASVRPGSRTLVIEGNGFADQNDDLLLELGEGLTGGGAHSAAAEPRTPKKLASAVAALHRPLGIAAHFRHRDPRVVLSSDEVRFDGRAKVRLQVGRARR